MQLYVVIDDYDGVVNIFNSEEEMYYEVDPADYPQSHYEYWEQSHLGEWYCLYQSEFDNRRN